MPPFEGLKNTYHSRPDRNPEEFAELVTRTEQGELNAYRAVWGGEYEDAVLFVPPRGSVAAAKRAYEELADENYVVIPISPEQARERLVSAENRRETARLELEKRAKEQARIEAERNAPVDVNGYAEFLRAEHLKEMQKPGIIKRLLGRLAMSD